MTQLHVAIVEDDADDMEFIVSALNSSSDKVQISTFSSGVEFVNELPNMERMPDIIVTDIRMPLMSGFEVISNVKRNEKTKNIPVVVLSTSGNQEDKEKAKQLGASAYFIKPFSIPKYCEITNRIISSFDFSSSSEQKAH